MLMSRPYVVNLTYTLDGARRSEEVAVWAYAPQDAMTQAAIELTGRHATPEAQDVRVLKVEPPATTRRETGSPAQFAAAVTATLDAIKQRARAPDPPTD